MFLGRPVEKVLFTLSRFSTRQEQQKDLRFRFRPPLRGCNIEDTRFSKTTSSWYTGSARPVPDIGVGPPIIRRRVRAAEGDGLENVIRDIRNYISITDKHLQLAITT